VDKVFCLRVRGLYFLPSCFSSSLRILKGMLNPARTLNCRGILVSLDQPLIMGILNATPDSFFDGGQYQILDKALNRVEEMLQQGATFIDIGGMSSRPGAEIIPVEEELKRVIPLIEAVQMRFPEALISVDTVRSQVAQAAVAAGASIVNDISSGQIDPKMYETVATLQVPYVMMHMQGTPKTMQAQPTYEQVVVDVLDFFVQEVGALRELGVHDIILDPGFGFGKSVSHNYELLANLSAFQVLDLPLLIGVSRKSMICKPLGINPPKALNGTSVLHLAALQQGASILRVHDVREASEVITLWELLESAPKM
jgi:dihydropteroate synthase